MFLLIHARAPSLAPVRYDASNGGSLLLRKEINILRYHSPVNRAVVLGEALLISLRCFEWERSPPPGDMAQYSARR